MQVVNSAKTVTDSYIYEAFGSLVASSGTTETVYGFTGEQFDDEVGLQYLRARYYDPEVGRFVSRDPDLGLVWFPQTLNRYVYVSNDPINNTDPIGLRPYIECRSIYLECLTRIPKKKLCSRTAVILHWFKCYIGLINCMMEDE